MHVVEVQYHEVVILGVTATGGKISLLLDFIADSVFTTLMI